MQTEQDLLGDYFDEGYRYTGSFMPLDNSKKVLAQRLKDKTYMDIVRSTMLKGIKEGDDMISTWMGGICVHDFAEKLNLVAGGLGIATCGFDDLESGMAFLARERKRREVSCVWNRGRREKEWSRTDGEWFRYGTRGKRIN